MNYPEHRFGDPRALTPVQVQEVRRRHKLSGPGNSQTALAKEFGVSQPCIRAIILRQTYKDVE